MATLALLAPGCATPEGGVDNQACPFENLGVVGADDAGELGFTATEVIAVASGATTAEASSAEVAGTWPVALTHEFTAAGEPSVIDFGQPDDAACPAGRALLVPAEYEVAGLIGDWPVQSFEGGLSLVATALALDAVSTVWDEAAAHDAWDATVDSDLEALARTTLPTSVSPDCEMTFTLGPQPDSHLAGAWAEEITDGWLNFSCDEDGFYGDFMSWTGTVSMSTPPPE